MKKKHFLGYLSLLLLCVSCLVWGGYQHLSVGEGAEDLSIKPTQNRHDMHLGGTFSRTFNKHSSDQKEQIRCRHDYHFMTQNGNPYIWVKRSYFYLNQPKNPYQVDYVILHEIGTEDASHLRQVILDSKIFLEKYLPYFVKDYGHDSLNHVKKKIRSNKRLNRSGHVLEWGVYHVSDPTAFSEKTGSLLPNSKKEKKKLLAFIGLHGKGAYIQGQSYEGFYARSNEAVGKGLVFSGFIPLVQWKYYHDKEIEYIMLAILFDNEASKKAARRMGFELFVENKSFRELQDYYDYFPYKSLAKNQFSIYRINREQFEALFNKPEPTDV